MEKKNARKNHTKCQKLNVNNFYTPPWNFGDTSNYHINNNFKVISWLVEEAFEWDKKAAAWVSVWSAALSFSLSPSFLSTLHS